MSLKWKPDLFEYSDYRKYLQDYYVAAKANVRAFSFRYFSQKAGFTSPNFLKLVMDGERNLSADSIERFALALKLTEEETTFFADLVAFGQAEGDEDRATAFERVASSRRFRRARRLDHAYYEYLSHWYYPAVREMAGRADFRDDPAWIAEQLVPKVTPAAVKRCLTTLYDLGLLVRDEANGAVTRGEPSLTTGHEVAQLGVANYHRQMLQRAADSISTVPASQRDVSALTVSVSKETVGELKRRIHAFRETLLELCDRDTQATAVYQLCIQLFPLTRPDASES